MLQKRSFGSVEITSVDRPALVAALRERAATLAGARPELQELHLYGSFARGDATPESDVDLLLIVDQISGPVVARADPYRDLFMDIPFDVWIQVYTRDEIERLRAEGNPFLRSVLEDAVPLFIRET